MEVLSSDIPFHFECLGSYRRKQWPCGDIDFLVTHSDSSKLPQILFRLVENLHLRGFLTDDLTKIEPDMVLTLWQWWILILSEATWAYVASLILAHSEESILRYGRHSRTNNFNDAPRFIQMRNGGLPYSISPVIRHSVVP